MPARQTDKDIISPNSPQPCKRNENENLAQNIAYSESYKMKQSFLLVIASLGILSSSLASEEDCICPLLDRPELWKKELTARWMVHSLEWGVLTTISTRIPDTPTPFGNVYSFVDGSCDESTGIPYFYGTYMDQTFLDMKQNPTASFTLSEAAISPVCLPAGLSACTIVNHVQTENQHHLHTGDPESPICARLVVTGTLQIVDSDTAEFGAAQQAFFQRHPQMQYWPADHDWIIAKLVIQDIWFIDYFGGATILNVDDYFAAELME